MTYHKDFEKLDRCLSSLDVHADKNIPIIVILNDPKTYLDDLERITQKHRVTKIYCADEIADWSDPLDWMESK